MSAQVSAVAAGSSPLTRGKHGHVEDDTGKSRLIPAHAGKTLHPSARASRAGAHPRSRGENVSAVAALAETSGSSPLTRGKHLLDALPDAGPGLIPAHAGKTTRPSRRQMACMAHPRSRGENSWAMWIGGGQNGSSPLTRGKRDGPACERDRFRLIPAHAGKTPVRQPELRPRRAHPRSRGENWMNSSSVKSLSGSSPLTRGKHLLLLLRFRLLGLIPAHAGKTTQTPEFQRNKRAHPRSRGENTS